MTANTPLSLLAAGHLLKTRAADSIASDNRGSASAPAFSFLDEAGDAEATGWYSPTLNTIAFACAGVDMFSAHPSNGYRVNDVVGTAVSTLGSLADGCPLKSVGRVEGGVFTAVAIVNDVGASSGATDAAELTVRFGRGTVAGSSLRPAGQLRWIKSEAWDVSDDSTLTSSVEIVHRLGNQDHYALLGTSQTTEIGKGTGNIVLDGDYTADDGSKNVLTLAEGVHSTTVSGGVEILCEQTFLTSVAPDRQEQRLSVGNIYGKRQIQLMPVAGGTSPYLTGAPGSAYTAPVTTVSNADDSNGPWMQWPTAGTGARSLIVSSVCKRAWNPECLCTIKTGSQVSGVRIWAGLNTDPMVGDTPTAHYMAFRYSTAADGTAFWRCLTDIGTLSPTVTVTTKAIAANTKYKLAIIAQGNVVRFYIDDELVATHTTNLPTSTHTLHSSIYVQRIGGTDTEISVGRMAIQCD